MMYKLFFPSLVGLEPTHFSFKDSVELIPDAVDDGLVRHCDTQKKKA